jgi:hypothetical protein
VLTVLVVAFVAVASPVHAQNRTTVNIDFAFVAAGTDMEAGAYALQAEPGKVTMGATTPKGKSVIMPVLTRLGRHDADTQVELVFDKVDGKLSLSEVWFPERDGYLVLNTPGDHEHRVLGGSRPRQ